MASNPDFVQYVADQCHRQPHLQPHGWGTTFHKKLQQQHTTMRRDNRWQEPTVPPASWLDAPIAVSLAEKKIYHRHVGPCHTRLLQTAHCRRCGKKHKDLHPQRQHHHIPRLTEEHRQTAHRPTRVSRLADRKQLRIRYIIAVKRFLSAMLPPIYALTWQSNLISKFGVS